MLDTNTPNFLKQPISKEVRPGELAGFLLFAFTNIVTYVACALRPGAWLHGKVRLYLLWLRYKWIPQSPCLSTFLQLHKNCQNLI